MPEVTVTFSGDDQQKRFAVFFDGGADAVLLLHGLRSDHREFADFPTQLADTGLTVLAMDLSGCGKSEGPGGYISPRSQLADIRAALAFLTGNGVSRVVVVGHSFGVHAALSGAKEFACIVAAIIVAPQPRSGASLTGLKRLLFRAWGVLRPLSDAFRFVSIPASKKYDELFVDPDARDWARRIDWDPGAYNLGTLGHATDMDSAALLTDFTKPVLAVIGSQDKKTRPERSLELIARLPGEHSRTVVLPNSGHSPFADTDKKQLLAETLAFLKDVFTRPETEGAK